MKKHNTHRILDETSKKHKKTAYNIKTKYIEYWLPGNEYWKEMFARCNPNDDNNYISNSSVIIKIGLKNNEYDDS